MIKYIFLNDHLPGSASPTQSSIEHKKTRHFIELSGKFQVRLDYDGELTQKWISQDCPVFRWRFKIIKL